MPRGRCAASRAPTCGGSAPTARRASPPEDLLGEVRTLFDFACRRDGEAQAVRAFNPTREENGYEPLGSVLETNTDDLPFLVDSVSGELESRGIGVTRLLHPIMATEREGSGQIRSVRDPRGAPHRESVMHFELDRRLGDEELGELEEAVGRTLTSVRAVVRDFPAMLERVSAMARLARAGGARYEVDEVEEVVDFLAWLQRGEFVFLGAREYEFSEEGISLVSGSGLGILADEDKSAFARARRRAVLRAARVRAPQHAGRRPAGRRQDQRPRARAPPRADGLRRRAQARRGRPDRRHVAPDRRCSRPRRTRSRPPRRRCWAASCASASKGSG